MSENQKEMDRNLPYKNTTQLSTAEDDGDFKFGIRRTIEKVKRKVDGRYGGSRYKKVIQKALGAKKKNSFQKLVGSSSRSENQEFVFSATDSREIVPQEKNISENEVQIDYTDCCLSTQPDTDGNVSAPNFQATYHIPTIDDLVENYSHIEMEEVKEKKSNTGMEAGLFTGLPDTANIYPSGSSRSLKSGSETLSVASTEIIFNNVCFICPVDNISDQGSDEFAAYLNIVMTETNTKQWKKALFKCQISLIHRHQRAMKEMPESVCRCPVHYLEFLDKQRTNVNKSSDEKHGEP